MYQPLNGVLIDHFIIDVAWFFEVYIVLQVLLNSFNMWHCFHFTFIENHEKTGAGSGEEFSSSNGKTYRSIGSKVDFCVFESYVIIFIRNLLILCLCQETWE